MYTNTVQRDPVIALLLELLAGMFGFLGIGWIYAGQVKKGLLLLIGYFAFAWLISFVMIVATLGLWLIVLASQNLIFAAISAYFVYRRLEQERALT